MRVKELTLHNFRGIKDLHLVFNTQYNVVVLVGVNGVGKSSVLDCINLFVQYHQMICDRYNTNYKNHYDFNKLILNSDVSIGADNSINKIELIFDTGCIIEYEIAGFTNHDKKTFDFWNEIHEKSERNIIENSSAEIFDYYSYYLSNRQIIYSTYFKTKKAENIIDFKEFSRWFKETEDLENETRLSSDIQYRHPVLEAVKRAVYSLFGSEYSSLTFKRTINKMIIKKLGKELSLDLLSDGEKNLLVMVGDLSRKLTEEECEELENPLEAEALVLIDEIELHLHPAWQRTIVPRLTQIFPNCQFIVTTHSPQVLSHVDPECIHILDYDGDNVVVKRPENSFGLDSNRILEDILGVPKRPQEIQDEMLELFRMINNNDLENAKKIVQELGGKIGVNEPELVKAEATIKRREIIGR